MFDSHIHGYNSYDSDADYNEMILSAISRNLSGICFTDHFEYVPKSVGSYELDYITGKFYGFDMNDYMTEIHSFAGNYSKNNFRVLTGVEFGLYNTNMDEIIFAMDNYEFDCIIGSVHYVNNKPDPYYPEYTEKYDKFTAYSSVLEKYIELLPKYPKINVMGHFDYVSRYSQVYKDRNMYYKDFPDHFDKLLTILSEMGISLEINTSTYIKRDNYPQNKLDINILKRYRELGGEMITIGSDAHKPENIAQGFNEMIDLLKNAGFPYLTHFEYGKPVLDKIK